jgi:hypothetical protein
VHYCSDIGTSGEVYRPKWEVANPFMLKKDFFDDKDDWKHDSNVEDIKADIHDIKENFVIYKIGEE